MLDALQFRYNKPVLILKPNVMQRYYNLIATNVSPVRNIQGIEEYTLTLNSRGTSVYKDIVCKQDQSSKGPQWRNYPNPVLVPKILIQGSPILQGYLIDIQGDILYIPNEDMEEQIIREHQNQIV